MDDLDQNGFLTDQQLIESALHARIGTEAGRAASRSASGLFLCANHPLKNLRKAGSRLQNMLKNLS